MVRLNIIKQNIKDCVKDLRNSFGDSSYIKNIRKRGYRLNCNSVFLIDDSKEIQIYHGMSGTANILLSSQSILKKLLSIK